ncbi:MAG TPA: FxsA family protein [Acidimicrobiales bacterium]
MIVLLGLLFLVVPIAELAVILQVAHGIGVLNTIAVLVLVSVVGAWLVKREGVGVLRRLQRSVDRGQLPHRELVDGGLILLAGALLITPGFLSDVLGVVLLLPPTRAVVRAAVLARVRRRVAAKVTGRFGPVIDVDEPPGRPPHWRELG